MYHTAGLVLQAQWCLKKMKLGMPCISYCLGSVRSEPDRLMLPPSHSSSPCLCLLLWWTSGPLSVCRGATVTAAKMKSRRKCSRHLELSEAMLSILLHSGYTNTCNRYKALHFGCCLGKRCQQAKSLSAGTHPKQAQGYAVHEAGLPITTYHNSSTSTVLMACSSQDTC